MRDVALGVALALVVWGAVAAAGRGEPEPPAAPVAVADDGGALREVVIHWDPRALDAVGPTWRDLLRELPPSVVVHVVAASAAEFEAFAELAASWGADPARLRPVVAGRRVSTWSRDRYTLLSGDDEAVLLVPPRPTEGNKARENDWAAPFALAAAHPFDVRVQVAQAVFDGGDLLVGDRVVLATQLLRGRNLGGALGDPVRLGSWLRTATGREPVLLGASPGTVPGHHIGMFVTLLGDTVLVGDPDAGLALLPPAAELPHAPDRRPGTLRSFHAIAEDLAARGLDVRRVPLVPLEDGLTYVSYNNALVERRADGLHAYVPQFGLPTLDAAGRAAYEAAGATVHPIDVRGIYRWNGTVRCLVNVLRRA